MRVFFWQFDCWWSVPLERAIEFARTNLEGIETGTSKEWNLDDLGSRIKRPPARTWDRRFKMPCDWGVED